MNIIKRHLASYRFSFRGVVLAFRHDYNFIFHLSAAVCVIGANVWLNVTKSDWLITLVLIGLAWMAEMFNSAMEKLADRVTTEQDPLIGQVKDLASGAVLIICSFAVMCAIIVYSSYLFH